MLSGICNRVHNDPSTIDKGSTQNKRGNCGCKRHKAPVLLFSEAVYLLRRKAVKQFLRGFGGCAGVCGQRLQAGTVWCGFTQFIPKPVEQYFFLLCGKR